MTYRSYELEYKNNVAEIGTAISNADDSLLIVITMYRPTTLSLATREQLENLYNFIVVRRDEEKTRIVLKSVEGRPFAKFVDSTMLDHETRIQLALELLKKLLRYDSFPNAIKAKLIDEEQICVNKDGVWLREIVNFTTRNTVTDKEIVAMIGGVLRKLLPECNEIENALISQMENQQGEFYSINDAYEAFRDVFIYELPIELETRIYVYKKGGPEIDSGVVDAYITEKRENLRKEKQKIAEEKRIEEQRKFNEKIDQQAEFTFETTSPGVRVKEIPLGTPKSFDKNFDTPDFTIKRKAAGDTQEIPKPALSKKPKAESNDKSTPDSAEAAEAGLAGLAGPAEAETIAEAEVAEAGEITKAADAETAAGAAEKLSAAKSYSEQITGSFKDILDEIAPPEKNTIRLNSEKKPLERTIRMDEIKMSKKNDTNHTINLYPELDESEDEDIDYSEIELPDPHSPKHDIKDLYSELDREYNETEDETQEDFETQYNNYNQPTFESPETQEEPDDSEYISAENTSPIDPVNDPNINTDLDDFYTRIAEDEARKQRNQKIVVVSLLGILFVSVIFVFSLMWIKGSQKIEPSFIKSDEGSDNVVIFINQTKGKNKVEKYIWEIYQDDKLIHTLNSKNANLKFSNTSSEYVISLKAIGKDGAEYGPFEYKYNHKGK